MDLVPASSRPWTFENSSRSCSLSRMPSIRNETAFLLKSLSLASSCFPTSSKPLLTASSTALPTSGGSVDGAEGLQPIRRHPSRGTRRMLLLDIGFPTALFGRPPGRGTPDRDRGSRPNPPAPESSSARTPKRPFDDDLADGPERWAQRCRTPSVETEAERHSRVPGGALLGFSLLEWPWPIARAAAHSTNS